MASWMNKFFTISGPSMKTLFPCITSHVRCLSSVSDIVHCSNGRVPARSNIFMKQIKTPLHTEELLNTLADNMQSLKKKHVVLISLQSLYTLQKEERLKLDPHVVMNHPSFISLCQHLRHHARIFDMNLRIECIKMLMYLKVPSNSILMQTLLQLIRTDINNLNLRQVMFFDFLLSRMEKTHLQQALRSALPFLFQIHQRIETDKNNTLLLKDMLIFASKHDLPAANVDDIVKHLNNRKDLDDCCAKMILRALKNVGTDKVEFPARHKLHNICIHISKGTIDRLEYPNVNKQASKQIC